MSDLASSNRVQMRYIQESVFGVTPTVGNPKNLRIIDESFDFALTKEQSKEIRPDRQVAGATTINAAANGDINIHMQYAEYDSLLAGALQSAYAVMGTNGETATFAAAYTANTITAAVAPTGTSAFTLLVPGQHFRIRHPGSLNNGKVFRVSATVAPSATVITLDPGTVAIVEASTAGAFLQSSRLANGVTESFFTFEKNFTDVGQFFAYRGQYVNKFSLKFASAALLEGSFGMMGKDAIRGNVTALPGTPIPSQTYEIQNAVKGVGLIWEGGAPLANTFIKSLDLNVDNNLRNDEAIGTLGPIGIGVGDFTVTGSLMAYFKTGALYDKFLQDQYTALTVSCQDAAGNGYVLTLPRVLLMTGKVVSGQKNSSVMAEFTFTAFADDANATVGLRKTLFIDRVGLPVV